MKTIANDSAATPRTTTQKEIPETSYIVKAPVPKMKVNTNAITQSSVRSIAPP